LKEWTILDILNWTKGFFEEKNLDNSRLNAELIISHVLGLKRLELYMKFDLTVSPSNRNTIKELIKRRSRHEPLQYVLGETEFYGYRFKVDPSVLIPRPETEYLVERIIKDPREAGSILEIGTGSGCIAISLAKELKNVKIDAADISAEALETASNNADINKVNINFLRSDIFSRIEKKYDLIVSNPPYIPLDSYQELPAEIKDFEPSAALISDEEGFFFYRRIIEEASEYLNPEGRLFFEIGFDQSKRIKLIAEKSGFKNIVTIKDLNEFDRIMIIG